MNGHRARAWVIAARPHTLPAAFAPVIVGTGLAINAGVFAVGPALAALFGATLIQIGTNLANDYYDAHRGVDTDDRDGFTRVTQAGLIPADTVKRAAFGTFGLSIIVGTYLVYVGGVPILVIGLLSIGCGIAYAGGPYPLGSIGLGDLFVFVFFGLVAVTGTYYVQAASVLVDPLSMWIPSNTITLTVVLASIPIGTLATAILVVNNLRDAETDRIAGKRTVVVIVGYRWSRFEYAALLGLAYVVPVWLWYQGLHPLVLLPLGTIPYAVAITYTVFTETSGEALNPALERSGRLLAAFSLLFAIGLVLP